MAQALDKSGRDWNPQVLLGSVLDKIPQTSAFSLMLRTFWFVTPNMKLESKFYGGPL